MTRSVSLVTAAALCGLLMGADSNAQCQYCPFCPVPAASANPPTTCPGGSVLLVAGLAAGTCTWAPTDGLEDPNSCSTTARPLRSTIYSATFVDAWRGCAVTVDARVLVPLSPEPVITAPASATPGQTGLSAAVPLHTAGDFQSSYDWTIANGEITSGQGTNAITFSVSSRPVSVDGATFVGISVVETRPGACPSDKASASVVIDGQSLPRRPRVVPFR